MTNLAAAGAAIMAEEHALEEAMHVAAVKVGRAGRAFGAENPAEYVFFSAWFTQENHGRYGKKYKKWMNMVGFMGVI